MKKSEHREEERRRAIWLRDLSVLEKRIVGRSHAVLAILLVIIMIASSFALIHSGGGSYQDHQSFRPQALSGTLASVGVSATYYTLASESNTPYTFSVPFSENSSYTSIPAFSSSSAWTESSSTVAGWTQNFGSMYFGMFTDTVNVELDQVAFNIGSSSTSGGISEAIGTVYANLTSPLDVTYTWSHTFNYASIKTSYAYIDPQWAVYDSPFTVQVGSWSVQFTDVLQPGYTWKTPPSGMTSNTGSQTNSIQTSLTGSNLAINGVIGISYGTQDGYFTIPSGEASYSIVFSSPSIPQIYSVYGYNSVVLDSSHTTTSGFLSGSSVNEMIGNANGDPNPAGSGGVATSASSVTYTITLENQEKAVLDNVGSYFSGSVAYNPSNPSPNEFTYAVPFSFSAPSGAYFGTYESGTDSFSTNSATFVPTVTVSALEQVGYSCSQAGFFLSLNNGSYSQQSNAQDHSYTYTNTYTSAQTIDNYIQTISVANTAPQYASSDLQFLGTGSEMKLYFNISQPVFSGETEAVSVQWGDGSNSNVQGTTYSLTFTHSYAKTGTYTITVSFNNVPSVNEGVLSSISGPTQVLTWQVAINPVITPVYGSQLTPSEPVNMHFTTVHDIVGTVTAYDSGTDFQSNTFNAASGSMTMYPPSEGLTGFTLTITFDGAFYSISYEYSSPLYPAYNSTFLVEIGGDSLTQQYPITITNAGTSASGNFVYNLTESSTYWSPYANPSISNVLFRYSNGSLIKSELVTHSSSSATWHLSLYSIPASGNAPILQIFYPAGEDVFINNSLTLSSYSSISQSIGSHENSTIVNTTNISYVPYASVGVYYPDPLLQAFTYFIPDYFNVRYMQVNWNASWIPSVYSPAYKAAEYQYASETLFSNISNVGEISVVFDQPSTQIGMPVQTSAQLQAGNQTIDAADLSEFIIQDRYTGFGSSTIQYINESSEYFTIPFGSTDTFYVLDPWGGVVGISQVYLIDGASFTFSMQLSLTLVTVQFINTSATTIQLSQHGIAATFNSYLAFYVQNDSSYQWYANIFDTSLGRNVNYSGSFRADSPSQILYVNVTAPLSQVTVMVDAYSGSGAGPLFSYPPDNVSLNINGLSYQVGTPLTFQVGELLTIKVLDPLGSILAEENLTVGATVESYSIQVSATSYELSFRNDEQAAPGSQLATEFINISQGASSYVFTDMVGDTASLYLSAGSYHLYLHDNATFSTNISLTENQNYVIFGQQLLTDQQFNSRIGQIYNSTDHFSIVPKNVPSLIQVGTPVSLDFSMYCSNGTPLSLGQMRDFVQNSTVTLESGQLSIPLSVTEGQYLEVNFTAPATAGSYVLFIQGYLSSGGSTISAEYSLPLTFQASVQVGMQLGLSVPAEIQAGVLTNGTITTEYGNGSTMNSLYTRSVLANLTILVYRNGNLISTVQPYYISPGTIGFGLNISVIGSSYTIYASVGKTLVSGSYAYSSAHSGFVVVGYNPTSGPPNSISQIGAALANNIDLIASVIGVLAALYYIYRYLRRRSITLRTEENDAGLNIESIIIEKVLAGLPLTQPEQVIYDKIPKDRLNKIINAATSGKIKQIRQKAKKVKKNEV